MLCPLGRLKKIEAAKEKTTLDGAGDKQAIEARVRLGVVSPPTKSEMPTRPSLPSPRSPPWRLGKHIAQRHDAAGREVDVALRRPIRTLPARAASLRARASAPTPRDPRRASPQAGGCP